MARKILLHCRLLAVLKISARTHIEAHGLGNGSGNGGGGVVGDGVDDVGHLLNFANDFFFASLFQIVLNSFRLLLHEI